MSKIYQHPLFENKKFVGRAKRLWYASLGLTLGLAVSAVALTGGQSYAAPKRSSTLPNYDDYSAINTAPNGLTNRIVYGTDGKGSQLTGCTVTVGSDFQTKINTANPGDVVCVSPGDYSGSAMTIANKSITVRALRASSPTATAKVKNIVITGNSPVTVDGFDVVGGSKLGSPNYAIKFSGTGHQIINNLVRGRTIVYGIGCDESAGCGTNVRIANNTITGINNYGIYLWGGSGITVEKNNIFDLYANGGQEDDVDATRIWGSNQVVRNNYFHDINGKKSTVSAHVDCIQNYQGGSTVRTSTNLTMENNYCVRVTGQCIIAQNDQRAADELRGFVVRGNVCETGGWQSIEFDGVKDITLDNNFVAGVQVTVLNFANTSPNGLSSNVKLSNNILVRGTAGNRYVDASPSQLTDNVANKYIVDTSIASQYNTFLGNTTGSYPPVQPTDFNQFFRAIASKVTPANQGASPYSGLWATDVDGANRVQGGTIDIGPFEFQ